MNIYLSPSEAIEAAERAYAFHLDSQTATLSAAREAAYRALIQYIVENPRHMARLLSEQEKRQLWDVFNEHLGWQPVLEFALRLAFTPPTPDVPEKIVELIDAFESNKGWTPDTLREFAVKCYEAGMAVSK